ncbi:MAG: vWA domain-containing protein [Enhygromyxa sp.]
MPRRALLAPLTCAALWAATPTAEAQAPIPATSTIEEQVHTVEVEIEREGATLRVTRSLFNPTPFPARVDLPIPLPCEAILDDLQVEELGPGGSSRWAPAALLGAVEASERFDAYYDGIGLASDERAMNADTGVLLSREGWSCDAELSLWPIPGLKQRTFAYRVFIPSVYGDGEHVIELPSFDGYGQTPTLAVTELEDAGLKATIGDLPVSAGVTLDGAHGHTIVLSPQDPGRGRVRVVDLELDALVRQTPAAASELELDAGPLPRLQGADFEAPAELAKLPPVRRAVILLDASRSVSAHDRRQLRDLAAAYFAALTDTDARVEVVLFDREPRRVYHDFVPARWGAEDLPKIEFEARNGSEVGEAVAYARALLAEPSAVEGADWILVLSDLYLRSDFDLAAERDAAADSSVRMHVIREGTHDLSFAPAAGDDPWTAVARAAGGMAWSADGGSSWADELVSPRRIWNLALELELADQSHRSEPLDRWLAAGSRREWADYEFAGPALVRAAFVGEVWGQRRAWTAGPDELENKRSAAALATHDPHRQLSTAVRTALAFHAEVISPFSSAWALAEFDGPARPPTHGYGTGFSGGGSYGTSTRCGGVRSVGHAPRVNPLGFDALAQQALDRCQPRGEGRYSFETTDLEIVAVESSNRCLAAQTWATDIEPTQSQGRKRVSIAYARGRVLGFEVAPG